MKYYLVGIKGAGMSALALILDDLGYKVVGYDDMKEHAFTEDKLVERGIKIYTDENDCIDENTIVPSQIPLLLDFLLSLINWTTSIGDLRISILHSWRIYLLRSSALQCEIRVRIFFFTWSFPGVYLLVLYSISLAWLYIFWSSSLDISSNLIVLPSLLFHTYWFRSLTLLIAFFKVSPNSEIIFSSFII